jgi:hypothetical protein
MRVISGVRHDSIRGSFYGEFFGECSFAFEYVPENLDFESFLKWFKGPEGFPDTVTPTPLKDGYASIKGRCAMVESIYVRLSKLPPPTTVA